jgi:hypothetical protein
MYHTAIIFLIKIVPTPFLFLAFLAENQSLTPRLSPDYGFGCENPTLHIGACPGLMLGRPFMLQDLCSLLCTLQRTPLVYFLFSTKTTSIYGLFATPSIRSLQHQYKLVRSIST